MPISLPTHDPYQPADPGQHFLPDVDWGVANGCVLQRQRAPTDHLLAANDRH